MNLSITVLNEVTPTAAHEETAVVNHNVSSTSAQLMPKKGILKRSSSHSNFPRNDATERNITGEFLEFKQSSDQFTDRPTTKIPKLTLTWSEKNAVAIFGDTTSDEAVTETDDFQIPIIASTSISQHSSSSKIPFIMHTTEEGAKSERQTAILYDDDENEDEEEMMKNEKEEAPHIDNEFDTVDTDVDTDDEQHDNAQMKSNGSIGNSHIAGKWWFGKSTKNVLHCTKWGCTHNHHDKESSDNGGKYLTPTQQRFKEIHHLKKQLKLALTQLEDKDLHLNELRNQLRDLESMVGSIKIMNEQRQLLQHKEINEDYEREKQKLIDKHEIRTRQLIQEAVDARAEMTRLQIALKELEEARIKVEVKDAEIMTEAIDDIVYSPKLLPPQQPSSPSPQIPSSPQVEHAMESRADQIPQDLPLQLQAYENEAMAWRIKAAQLEMVLQDQIFKTKQDATPELERCRNENECLRTYIKKMEANKSNHAMTDSGIQENLNLNSPIITIDCYSQRCEERKKQLEEENQCLLEKIKEDKLCLNEYEEDINFLRQTVHSMEEENKKNSLTMEQMFKEIEERTAEVEAANIIAVRLQSEMAIKTKAICYLEERHQVYRNTILDHDLVVKDESTKDWERGFSDPRYVINVSKRVQTDLTEETLRTNEVKFVNLADKLEVLKKELSSKESSMLERFQEIEKDLLMKNSLVGSLANQLEETDREATRTSDLHQKEREAFQEKLCELGQLVESVPILQFEIEKLQQERSLLECRLKNVKEEYEADLDAVLAESLKKYQEQSNYWAEKVSAMNASNEMLRNENIALRHSINDLKLRTQVQKADMSKRLTSSISHICQLKKQLNRSTRDVQVDVHPRVVSKYVACRPNARHKMTDIEKGDLSDEVEERLEVCQDELTTNGLQIATLQQKLVDSVQTQVEDRSLHTNYSSNNALPADKKLSTSMIVNDEKESKLMLNDNSREQIEELEKQNHDLAVQLHEIKTENQNILDDQRQQILHHISEFNNFRKELNQELGHYENERQKLTEARNAVLEKVKEERELLKNKTVLEKKCSNDSSSQSILQMGLSSIHTQEDSIAFADDHKKTAIDQKIRMKRWVSVPHLFRLSTIGKFSIATVTSNEITTLRERNSILARNNANLKQELIGLRRFIESSKRSTSRVFSNNDTISTYKSSSEAINKYSHGFDLAADLIQVQEDLENVIIQIDNSVITNKNENNHQKKSPSLSIIRQNIPSSSITELEHLKIALKNSHEEQKVLAEQLDRVTLDFQDACRELNLYKHELREDALKYSHNIRLPRTRSFAEIGRATIDLDEHMKWKEKAGTMFRELNRIRKEYRACDSERREIRMQLVMLRGELGLAQCQLAEMLSNQRREQRKSISNVSVISENGTSSSSMLNKRKKNKSRLLRGSRLDEFWDQIDSSSSIFFTACASMSSFNEIMCSKSEPELAATEFDGVREYRLSSYGYRDYHCGESRRPSVYLEKIQHNSEEHEKMIKNVAKRQIKSLDQIKHQEKDIREKDFCGTQSECRLPSYEEQSVKSRQKLRNLKKKVAVLEK
ncbi:unnamed protein product [Cercopithifilaria johnstoni]|uniref:Uncharacterized protein n=1 Tax=Cercopithifilaria johnstoni TaxID=2874296 RepID=A0A8J2M234_9BILA|nr:unnamed protein product [Cercopithifilaria johnstoni]